MMRLLKTTQYKEPKMRRRTVLQIKKNSKGQKRIHEAGEAIPRLMDDVDTRVSMIQALIPLGLKAVHEELQQAVAALAGKRHQHDGLPGHVRWGSQAGSVYLGDQKVGVMVPRVRDRVRNQEVPLDVYHQLQDSRQTDDLAMRRVLKGLSCGDYESCVQSVPQTFGLKPSTVSNRFRRATRKHLQALAGRDLKEYDFVAVFIDGKTFAEDQMVIALGITLEGQKVVLGFVQTATENEAVCSAFLRKLVERGLRSTEGLLFVIDGAKGLRAAIRKVFSSRAAVQRCIWHKRENILRYLPKGKQAAYRRELQEAYEKPTYAQAKRALKAIRSKLVLLNQSAAASLDEGIEETLTLHRLDVFEELGTSFKTTNCIENINSLVQQHTAKVDRWVNSDQKQRWLATALLDIEPRLRRVRGCKALPKLRAALKQNLNGKMDKVA
jgi:putative transposase